MECWRQPDRNDIVFMDHILQTAIDLIVRFPLFLIAIMLHEVGHGYAALRYGDTTARDMGRLTLNPVMHIDPVGLMVFVISSIAGVGFGWAKPVPINPSRFSDRRQGMIVVSLAGVAANLALILFTIFLIKALSIFGLIEFLPAGGFISGYAMRVVLRHMMWFMMLNGVLLVFNLIPIPPLDGSKVLMTLLPREQAVAFASIERYGLIIIFGLLFFHVLDYIFYAAISVVNSLAFFVFML